ncbi:MAG TPA: hypothetical protein VFY80_08225 [Burkholderiales bacterium]|nr:hypothetical protein [Burkholderiales bacterium]
MFALVKGVYQAAIEMEGDDYVPISARTRLGWTGELIALRYGDYRDSLLEIMFDSSTGIVTRLAMPAWKHVNVLPSIEVNSVPGVPVIEPPSQTFEGPSGWKRLDCSADFSLTVHERELTLSIEGGADPIEGIGDGRLVFLVGAAKQLVGLRVRDLTTSETQALRVR